MMFEIRLQETRVYQEAKEEGLKEGLKIGREEGLKIGREEAREKGRQQGLKIGREEAQRELIPRLLARGMSMEEVAKLLKLTIEQVRLISEQESSTPT